MTGGRLIALLFGVWLSGVWLVASSCCATEPVSEHSQESRLERFEFLQIRMAVPVRMTVYARDEPSANQAAQAAYARIRQIDRLLSHYDPDSELSQLGRNYVPGTPVRVSNELFTVLSAAAGVSAKSGGAFDVTVGPLMDLWRKSRRSKHLPAARELNAARRLVGYQNVRLDRPSRSVSFAKNGMRLDLGGIAKGYAADEALRVLNEHGIERALIDAGGDIVAGGPPPGTDGWRIGIAPLGAPDGEAERFLSLHNAAVATSGDASQYVEIDGVRYSHILDPRTGLGLTTRSSVTVVARDGITADSWASAVSILGPERGLKVLCDVPNAQALILVREPDGIHQWESAGFHTLE